MKTPHEIAAELILQAIETSDTTNTYYANRIAKRLGNADVLERVRLRFVDLILNGPTPKERPLPCVGIENDIKIEKLTEWDALPEAAEIALSKNVRYLSGHFFPLIAKLHEAGLSDLENQVIRRYHVLNEQKCAEHNDPMEPDYYFNRAPFRHGYEPEFYRDLGFDLSSSLKHWETLTLSPETLSASRKSRGHEMIVEDCLTLLSLYAKAGYLDEAERFRSFLRDQLLPESVSQSKEHRVFEGIHYSLLAWLPDGFSSNGEPFYRSDEDSNLHLAVKSLIECNNFEQVGKQFYTMCWVREEADWEAARSRTLFLADSVAKFPSETFHAWLYNAVSTRSQYMNDQEFTDLILKAIEALNEQDVPGCKESQRWDLICRLRDRNPELMFRLAKEYPPPKKERCRLNLTFELKDENIIKELIRLFRLPENRVYFNSAFVPLFLERKLNFPVAWIDELIDLTRKHQFMQGEADMLLAKFVHRSLFAGEENTDELLHAALEMIRSIEGDPIYEQRNPNAEGYRAEKFNIWMYSSPDVCWKPTGLLHAAKSLAFVGRIEEALNLKEKHFAAREHVYNLSLQGKVSERGIGYTVEEYCKLQYVQANCDFLLTIADAIADSLGKSKVPPFNE